MPDTPSPKAAFPKARRFAPALGLLHSNTPGEIVLCKVAPGPVRWDFGFINIQEWQSFHTPQTFGLEPTSSSCCPSRVVFMCVITSFSFNSHNNFIGRG